LDAWTRKRGAVCYVGSMKRILCIFILASLAAGLAGCKADPGSRASSEMDKSVSAAPRQPSEAPSPVVPDAPAIKEDAGPDMRPVIVCFGDSLTAGYGADEGQSYPDFLQKDLDNDGYRYRVVNEGISGNTTKDGVERLASIVRMKPALVVLEFGGNDGLRGLKVETTRSNLATMIAALQKAKAKVVLAGMTLPPDYGPDYVKAFTDNYPVLGRKYDVPVIPFLLKDVFGVNGMMQADGIHATDQGNEVVAKNVLPLVESQVKR
jgi:acyl-CoA thioesterase-1